MNAPYLVTSPARAARLLPAGLTRPGSGWIMAVCLFGLFLTLSTFYPGLMTEDSAYTYGQALDYKFSDGHPPIVTLLWHALLMIRQGPAPLFILFTGLYWAGFCLLAIGLHKRSLVSALLAVLFAFSPMLLNFVGAIWKDVYIFTLYLGGVAIVLYLHLSERPIGWPVLLLVTTLFVAASLGRHNTVISGLPLVVLAMYLARAERVLTLRQFWKLFFVASAIYLVYFIALHSLVQYLTHPNKMHASSMLFVYDLIGMSVHAKQYLLPASQQFDLNALAPCYEHKGWDRVWLSCTPLLDELRASGEWTRLGKVWWNAISDNPMAYLAHRYAYFSAQFDATWLVYISDPHPMSFKFGFEKGGAFLKFDELMLIMRKDAYWSLLLTNGFWICTNAVLFLLSFAQALRRFTSNAAIMALLTGSGFLYSAPLFFGGIAPDFRYVYWSIGISLISIAFWAGTLFQQARPARRAGVEKMGLAP